MQARDGICLLLRAGKGDDDTPREAPIAKVGKTEISAREDWSLDARRYAPAEQETANTGYPLLRLGEILVKAGE